MTSPPEAAASTSRSPSPIEDIAAAMGFGTFGRKPNPPKKKRKLADLNSEGSGTNNTPLGVRSRRIGVQDGMGEEGLDGGQEQGHAELERRDQVLGEDQMSESQDGIAAEHGFAMPDVAADESTKPIDPNNHHQPRDRPPSSSPPNPNSTNKYEPRHPSMEHSIHPARAQIQRPATIKGGSQAGRKADGSWDWVWLKKGVEDGRGDTVFYDQSFVEDPWLKFKGQGGKGWRGQS